MHWLGLATFQSISPASFKPDFAVSGFPEYKTTIESLDAAQRLELQRAALAIVNTMSSAAPVRGIIAIGNADVALRKAQSERAGFEREVSQSRADHGLAVLLDEVARISGNPAARYMFKTRAVGIGSANRKVVNAATEAEMRQNRRVEFVLFHEQVGRATCGTR